MQIIRVHVSNYSTNSECLLGLRLYARWFMENQEGKKDLTFPTRSLQSSSISKLDLAPHIRWKVANYYNFQKNHIKKEVSATLITSELTLATYKRSNSSTALSGSHLYYLKCIVEGKKRNALRHIWSLHTQNLPTSNFRITTFLSNLWDTALHFSFTH